MKKDNFDRNARTGMTRKGSQKDCLIEHLQDRVKALESKVKYLSDEVSYLRLSEEEKKELEAGFLLRSDM